MCSTRVQKTVLHKNANSRSSDADNSASEFRDHLAVYLESCAWVVILKEEGGKSNHGGNVRQYVKYL